MANIQDQGEGPKADPGDLPAFLLKNVPVVAVVQNEAAPSADEGAKDQEPEVFAYVDTHADEPYPEKDLGTLLKMGKNPNLARMYTAEPIRRMLIEAVKRRGYCTLRDAELEGFDLAIMRLPWTSRRVRLSAGQIVLARIVQREDTEDFTQSRFSISIVNMLDMCVATVDEPNIVLFLTTREMAASAEDAYV